MSSAVESTAQPNVSESHRKWFNSPVSFRTGSLTTIRDQLPEFERRGFTMAANGNEPTRRNSRLDTIVRKPFGDDGDYVPVGVVSRDYTFLPHTDVVDTAHNALTRLDIPAEDVKAELCVSEYGERMALSLFLPADYGFDPGDGHPLTLRLECFNSVEGSTRFQALMGWYRQVCSNGLLMGVTRLDLRRRHVGSIPLEDIDTVLANGIEEASGEKENLKHWRRTEVDLGRLEEWADNELRTTLGFKAAARAFRIAETGHDAEITGPYKDHTPTTIPTETGCRVPGAPARSKNLYDISQILAWLARQRRDVQEQLEWRGLIPDLLASLNT